MGTVEGHETVVGGQEAVAHALPPFAAPETAEDIAVVICTHDLARWGMLQEAVGSIRTQTLQPAQLIVVVDHNEPLLARARSVEDAEVVANSNEPGLSGARNAGVAAARTSLEAFLDDDAVAEPAWLERLVDAMEGPGVLAAGGRTEPAWECAGHAWFPEEFLWVVGASYRGLPTERAPVRNVFGGNMIVRRAELLSIGGFSGHLGKAGGKPFGCEETEVCIKLHQANPGSGIVYEPAAAIRHRVPESRCRLRYFLSRCFHEGLSKATMTQVVGKRDGLSSERSYLWRLPASMLRHVGATRPNDLSGIARAAGIALGVAWTGTGYVFGRARLATGRRQA